MIPESLLQRRYKNLGFFLFDARTPDKARQSLSPQAAFMVLEGIIGGKLATLCWVVNYIIRDKWENGKMHLWFIWHINILRKTPEQIDKLLEAETQ